MQPRGQGRQMIEGRTAVAGLRKGFAMPLG